jgi:GNAT superfamily N-acetyltransferase
MKPQLIVTAERPGSFSKVDREDFIAMVRAGGEVEGRRTLAENVRDAERLAFARQDGCLVGVGAFKRPKLSYRIKVEKNSGASLGADQFPFEFGYLFVLPSARRQGLSFKMWRALIAGHEGNGIFATARVQNKEMAAILPLLGFAPAGIPYRSSRGKHKLQLFVYRPVQSNPKS